MTLFFANRCLLLLELENWLVNAFNGEWLKVKNAKPMENVPLALEEKEKM